MDDENVMRAMSLAHAVSDLVAAAEYERALAMLEEARIAAEKDGDAARQAEVCTFTASVLESSGRRLEALTLYPKALALAEQGGQDSTKALIYNDLGYLYFELGRFDESVEATEKALEIDRRTGNMRGVAQCLNNLAAVPAARGRFGEALEQLQEALSLAETVSDIGLQAASHSGIAGIYESQARYDEALKGYRVALELSERAGRRDSMGIYHNNLGLVYMRLGDDERALAEYGAALRIATELRDADLAASVQNALAEFDERRGDVDAAIDRSRLALKLAKRLGDRALQATLLSNLAGLYRGQGRVQRAADEYLRAINLADQVGPPEVLASSLAGLGYIRTLQGSHAQARRYLDRAVGIAASSGLLLVESVIEGNIGYLQEKQGKFEAAYASYANAIEVVEAARALQIREESRRGFFAGQLDLYEVMVRLCLMMGRSEDAWHYAERSRSRSLVDRIASESRLARDEISPDLRARNEAARNRILELMAGPASGGSDIDDPTGENRGLGASFVRLRLAIAAHRQTEEELALAYPEFASAGSLEGDSLARVRQVLRDDAPVGTGILEYFRTGASMLAWVITADELRGPATLDLDYEELRQSVLRDEEGGPRYRLAVDPEDGDRRLTHVSTQLIQPLLDERLLSGVTHLWIVPHDVLHYIPWAALPLAGGRLVEVFTEIATLPSAATVSFWMNRRNQAAERSDLALVFDPDGTLPGASLEASLIREIYDGAIVSMGEGTTVEQMASAVAGRGIVHVAAHGILNLVAPELSGLQLADRLLTIPEVINDWRLQAELVILSACDLARGRVLPGDDVTALPRAFLYAGAAAVIASMYEVDDDETAELMANVHRKLASGSRKGLALAEAQREAITAGVSPRVWAPFVLLGDAG